MTSPRRPRIRFLPLLAHAVLILGGVTMLVPLLWMVSTSLKAPDAVGEFPPEFIPRDQVTWRGYPVFNLRAPKLAGAQPPLASGTPADALVVRLRTGAGYAEVAQVFPGGRLGPAFRVELAPGVLTPAKVVRLRWSNYPEAWSALRLQRNWLAWDLPYQVNLGFAKLGPFRFPGFPLRNAFVAFYLNSLIVTVLVTGGAVFTSSLAAFAFSRLSFPGRDRLFLGYLGTMMVPAVVTMIPVFVLLKVMGWIDTYLAMILPPMFTAYGTFLLRQFFLAIPRDLEDAAKIDGCGLWGVYRHVILPLSGPALATLTTFIFLGTWNSFMWPLIVINSMEKRPLMLGLYAFMSQYNTDWPLLMAASVMVMAPVIVVFILGQRYFVKGIVLSGMKG
ncbi:MAG: carbohydrate ABC transporter permease [Armatimonadetes bacterium]|nr:carbohydrate ABC transporter permease [Armatimonadota bacterium]